MQTLSGRKGPLRGQEHESRQLPWESLLSSSTYVSSPALGDAGIRPEIRKLLLCFPFGLYLYVQDSLGRKAGSKISEQEDSGPKPPWNP